MLHINALRLEINTTNGLYGTIISFNEGLNVVRANNTSGKSTIFQSIIYALGFEELIGSRNEKTMQSVLKDVVFDDDRSFQVLQSQVLLEIFNGIETITIRRSVINEKRKPQLIDVVLGPLISQPEGAFEMRQMYVHDKGAATDDVYGFHLFLEEFLNWSIPNVLDTQGNGTRLYLPLIAPAFIVEQKSGWSSFFATIPYYGVKNAEERVIEFLLDLDIFQNEQDKISLNIARRLTQEKWKILYDDFQNLAYKGGAEVVGLELLPVIINNPGEIYFRVYRNDRFVLIPDLIEALSEELEELNKQTETTVGENIQQNQIRLSSYNENAIRLNHREQQLADDLLYEKEKFKQYLTQRKTVEEDLKKNKAAEKMLRLGAEIDSKISNGICPTCGQKIDDSLLPAEIDQVPMKINDNINFLTSQLKMLEAFINNQKSRIREKEMILSQITENLARTRQDIRNIKRDLVSDERLPSEELIERKLNIKRLVNFYVEFIQNIDELKKRLILLSKDWEKVKKKEAELSGEVLTPFDREKLQFLQIKFLKLLEQFNYRSKDSNAIKISTEKYLPVIEIQLPNGYSKSYDIMFDSSGSDHIRTMWAYYISLAETSNAKGGNHPKLLMFDEPQQQSAGTENFREFLKELSGISGIQSIVFASFQNSQKDFEEATNGLKFNLIEGKGRFVRRLSDFKS